MTIACLLGFRDCDMVMILMVVRRRSNGDRLRQGTEVALGTAFGEAIFLVCFTVGLGAPIAPLRFSLPREIPCHMASMPLWSVSA